MNFFEAILLGIVQALTEFLPVSSSGHLVIFQHFLGLKEPLLVFDVMLHVGSLAAVLAFYRREVSDIIVSMFAPSRAPNGRRLIAMIMLASVPTAIVGLGFEKFVESLFQEPMAVAFYWILTASLLFAASRLTQGTKTVAGITISDALLIGLFQGIAILPGVSRSGATIVMGIMCGLHPREAANFSFLIYIPAIFGASLLQLKDLGAVNGDAMGIYVVGMIVAAVVSYAAIWFLLRLLRNRILQPFAWYCLAAAAITLMLLGLSA